QTLFWTACIGIVHRKHTAAHLTIPHPSNCRYRHPGKRYRFYLADPDCANDVALQPYGHRLYPPEDSVTHQHTHQHFAHLGLLYQTDEVTHEILRYQAHGRPAATHRRPPSHRE